MTKAEKLTGGESPTKEPTDNTFSTLQDYGEEHPLGKTIEPERKIEQDDKGKESQDQIDESGLTDEEKEYFKQFNQDLSECTPQTYVENLLLDAYVVRETNQIEPFKKGLGYLKRNLLNTATRRNISIEPESKLDKSTVLSYVVTLEKERNDENQLLANGFEVDYFEDPKKLQAFFVSLTSDMDAEQTKDVAWYFQNIADGFRSFMALNIPQIIANIDEIIEENPSISDLSQDKPIIKVVNDDEVDNWADDDDVDWVDDDDVDWVDDDDVDWVDDDKEEHNVSDEDIIKYLKFVNSLPYIIELKANAMKTQEYLLEQANEKKLMEFHNDKDFMRNFAKIMKHDKQQHIYYFHGTQSVEDAQSITEQGLGMMRNSINTTAYREFNMDDVILYERGIGGEVGHSAVVLIDMPINEKGEPENIIDEKASNYSINFVPSGLQGYGEAKYIINPKHIVGFVDKINKKIVFNDKHTKP